MGGRKGFTSVLNLVQVWVAAQRVGPLSPSFTSPLRALGSEPATPWAHGASGLVVLGCFSLLANFFDRPGNPVEVLGWSYKGKSRHMGLLLTSCLLASDPWVHPINAR